MKEIVSCYAAAKISALIRIAVLDVKKQLFSILPVFIIIHNREDWKPLPQTAVKSNDSVFRENAGKGNGSALQRQKNE